MVAPVVLMTSCQSYYNNTTLQSTTITQSDYKKQKVEQAAVVNGGRTDKFFKK